MIKIIRTDGNRIIIFSACILLLITTITSYSYLNQKTPSILGNNNQSLFNLLPHWSYGNIVAIIRHVERCDRSKNQCLKEKKGITVVGRDNALKLGKDFKELLSIMNATIYHSPIKRTEQTAKFMFGGISKEKKWLREGCKKNLYNDIFKYKEEEKNLILITHSTCLDHLGVIEGNKLINMDIHHKDTYGITIFIAIDNFQKEAHVLGYLYAKDWNKAFNLYRNKT